MQDSRHLPTGAPIPGLSYCDQPYVVRTDEGAWLCVMTSASGEEGHASQNVFSMRSTDQGKSWSKPLALEPPGSPEASYAVLFKTPFGRIYAFYNHNTDNVREVKTETGGALKRVDSLGHYVFRYTDDGGRSWSPRRYEVPIRPFACDRNNVYGGKLRFFWNVGKPILLQSGAMLLPHHKVGAMGAGFFAQSEGAFLRSENIATERDPEKIRFVTLPEGEVGLRTPPGGGRISEEQSVVELSDGTLYCVYRSVDGHPVCAYSHDGGRHWTPPVYAPFKHPRAANFVWKCQNGRFLYWFHNHGGKSYDDRNPVWLVAGEEQATPQGRRIRWGQPEVALYDDDPAIRISYPDLIEEGGAYFLTETQKSLGRVHRLDPALIEALFTPKAPTGGTETPGKLPDLRTRAGFSLEFGLAPGGFAVGQSLIDTRLPDGRGLQLSLTERRALRLTLSDGQTLAAADSDSGLLLPGKRHRVTVMVDGGPKLILFVIDGKLCDGGTERQFGWSRFSPHLRDPNGAAKATLVEGVESLRFYPRALRVGEAHQGARN